MNRLFFILNTPGIGEYVQEPSDEEKYDHSTGFKPYSISPNAVILNDASPIVISDAIMELRRNDTLRTVLGMNGRAIIEAYFTVERQMNQYSTLYKELVRDRIK